MTSGLWHGWARRSYGRGRPSPLSPRVRRRAGGPTRPWPSPGGGERRAMPLAAAASAGPGGAMSAAVGPSPPRGRDGAPAWAQRSRIHTSRAGAEDRVAERALGPLGRRPALSRACSSRNHSSTTPLRRRFAVETSPEAGASLRLGRPSLPTIPSEPTAPVTRMARPAETLRRAVPEAPEGRPIRRRWAGP